MFWRLRRSLMFFWQRLQGTTFVVIARLFFEKFEISENKAFGSNKADIVLQVKRVLMVSRFFTAAIKVV